MAARRPDWLTIPPAAALLLWPALWNRYPIVFADTGTYLSQAIHRYAGWDRPVFYSLFIFPLHATRCLWPIVVTQALLTAWLLRRVCRLAAPSLGSAGFLLLIAGLAVGTWLPWLVSEVMPDLFTPLLVLAVWALAWPPGRMSMAETAVFSGLTAFMIATQQSSLPLSVAVIGAAMVFGWDDHGDSIGGIAERGTRLMRPVVAGLVAAIPGWRAAIRGWCSAIRGEVVDGRHRDGHVMDAGHDMDAVHGMDAVQVGPALPPLVMAGLDPATRAPAASAKVAGSSPAMTDGTAGEPVLRAASSPRPASLPSASPPPAYPRLVSPRLVSPRPGSPRPASLPSASPYPASPRPASPRPGFALACLIPPALAVIALCSVNLAAHGRFAVSPFGNIFLLARVLYDGPGMAVLRRDCPDAGWRLCTYLDRMPNSSDAFLWTGDSPLNLAGGPKRITAEAAAIIHASLRTDPLGTAFAALRNSAEQLTRFASGDGLNPWPAEVTPKLAADFPSAELARYAAARQQSEGLDVPIPLSLLHDVVAIAGVVGSLLLLPGAWRRRNPAVGLLIVMLVALPVNAAVTGALSGPHDRYQARLMWLPPFVALLVLAARRQRDT